MLDSFAGSYTTDDFEIIVEKNMLIITTRKREENNMKTVKMLTNQRKLWGSVTFFLVVNMIRLIVSFESHQGPLRCHLTI